MTQAETRPRLSVVVVSFNGPVQLERCLAALAEQTTSDAVEVLIAGTHQDLRHDPCSAEWVQVPPDANVPQLRALGMGRARGDVVALLEDDCVPSDTWCEDVLRAHEAMEPAIGGAIEPGDFDTRLDWALYFLEYGRHMTPLERTDAQYLPGTNVSYKREAIAPFLNGRADRDGGFYEAFVHQALRDAGRGLRSEPGLVVHNLNSWTASGAAWSRYHHGRGFAGMRVIGRPRWQKLLYAAMSVALPVLMVARAASLVRSKRRHMRELIAALPWIAALSASWSVGEFVGYLLGPGQSLRRWR